MTSPIEDVAALTVAMAHCPQCQRVCSAVKSNGRYVMAKANCHHAISARDESGAPVFRFARDE